MLKLSASLICGMLLFFGYLFKRCRMRRFAAEAKLEGIERERMEWDSKNRKLLREFAQGNGNEAVPRLLSSLASNDEKKSTLSSFGKAIDMEEKVLVNPEEVTMFDLIGTGGFGCVYRGTWRGEPVAVKVMNLHGEKERYLKSFIKEADIMSR